MAKRKRNAQRNMTAAYMAKFKHEYKAIRVKGKFNGKRQFVGYKAV